MSGRPTPDIAAALRKFIEWYGCDPGVPMSAVDVANEAADRLAELDAEVERLRTLAHKHCGCLSNGGD